MSDAFINFENFILEQKVGKLFVFEVETAFKAFVSFETFMAKRKMGTVFGSHFFFFSLE